MKRNICNERPLVSLFKVIVIGAVMTLGLAGCATTYKYDPVDVTNTMAAQLSSIEFYTPGVGEEVKTLYVDRTGSFINDLNKVENGTWYRAHEGKLVSVEAVKTTALPLGGLLGAGSVSDQWRVEYVD
jgi:hypothetical protein